MQCQWNISQIMRKKGQQLQYRYGLQATKFVKYANNFTSNFMNQVKKHKQRRKKNNFSSKTSHEVYIILGLYFWEVFWSSFECKYIKYIIKSWRCTFGFLYWTRISSVTMLSNFFIETVFSRFLMYHYAYNTLIRLT